MDCKQADMFIMRYAEKTIEPADAKKLAEHLISCESCRLGFTVFDICLDDTEMFEAPEDFTKNVMAKVGDLRKENPELSYGLRFVWGLSAIFVGAFLFLVFNTETVSSYLVEYLEFNTALRPFFENLSASLGQIEHFGVATFLFIPLIGVLLYVLHQGDKSVA